jgi:hypothetical protein
MLMPNQSPGAGFPDPVVPPTELSLTEVKVMGLVEVPTASRVPATHRVGIPRPELHESDPPVALTTVPGATVRVMPAGTVRVPLMTYAEASDGLHVVLDVSVPDTSRTGALLGTAFTIAVVGVASVVLEPVADRPKV